ncbi:MAG: hypothetical protein CMM61_14685 [Rhodospirillaceae bacterium]|nr:hypothetical protein [Rhodospirillaceae bacterium]
MAKRPQGNSTAKTKSKTTGKTAKADSAEILRNTVIETTMAIAARDGWRGLRLARVADESGLSLAQILIPFPDKYAVMNAFQDRIDAAMLAEADALASGGDDGGDVRDRLFDLIMARFDALAPYRAAMAEIARDALRDPGSARFLPRMARSMSRILEAAGVGATGLAGAARAKGLALVYADAFRTWLGDDTADQSKTMATLDRGLARAEKAQRFLARICATRIPRYADTDEGGKAAETLG